MPSGLDLLVAIVGEPGDSKTMAWKLGRLSMPKLDTMNCPTHLLDMIDGLSISSGPGLIESFMGEEGDECKPATNGLFYCDEGSVLKQISARNGEILDEILRSIFAGTPLSTPNATKERWRHVEGYCIGVVINMTPKAVGPLLAQSGDGSPQRFLWLSAADPNMPRNSPRNANHPESSYRRRPSRYVSTPRSSSNSTTSCGCGRPAKSRSTRSTYTLAGSRRR